MRSAKDDASIFLRSKARFVCFIASNPFLSKVKPKMKRSVYWIFLLHIIFFVHGNKAGASQPYRTAYHFQPPKNWMNDPNGKVPLSDKFLYHFSRWPMYHKGVYHLFYQYNPYAVVWGNISWAHSVSYNLIDWMHLDNAINPTESYDINGCFSGSATIFPGVEKPVILYTGNNFENHQVQNLAVPKNMSDPLLREWVKSDRNPVMAPVNGMNPMMTSVNDIKPDMYRDPTTASVPNLFYTAVIIGSQINGMELLFFIEVKILLAGPGVGILFICQPKQECGSVLIFTLQLRYDYGMFYASKTFYDCDKKRRILWGWVTEADSKSDDIKKGWSGIQSIPRTVLLDKKGKHQINGHGAAILYRSKDFVSWTRSRNPLYLSTKTGMWECPDFYPVSSRRRIGLHSSFNDRKTKHVLKASFSDHDYYVIGNYDSKTDRYSVDVDFMDTIRQLRYDYGMFYASKTFYDCDKKRRILWGWVTEADSKSDDIKKGWSGIQSIPRTVLLDKTGKQLVQYPIKELEKLRASEVSLHNKEIKGGTVLEISGLTASQADIEVSFQLPNLEDRVELMDKKSVDPQQLCSQKNSSVKGVLGPFGLLALTSKDLTEQTAIFFRIFKGHDKYVVLMCSDQSRSSLKRDVDKKIFGAFLDVDPSQRISLRTLIDHSMLESFGGEGKACITARVHPELAIENKSHLYAFNYGTESITISSLRAWSMKKAQMYRALAEKAADAFYKLSNTKAQIQAYVFDAPTDCRPGSRDRVAHFDTSSFDDANEYEKLCVAVIRASVPRLDVDSAFEQKNDIAKAVDEELEKVIYPLD
ncbi:unnamed protein product [Fraxinus pennsylvanica]|uniref:Uncharacterized protein n=1 Tax=Fraxinus pennsylvanica TaxID=56036 RepID=A0AAD1YYQ9_9LAMI|nr:unnamed protein product [Fraxinus pennsylvanica]